MTHLILHKVRGEPAYDVAHQMRCPECIGDGCDECEGTGHWWITTTYGHRAYPVAVTALSWLDLPSGNVTNLRDHYHWKQEVVEYIDLRHILSVGPSLSRRP